MNKGIMSNLNLKTYKQIRPNILILTNKNFLFAVLICLLLFSLTKIYNLKNTKNRFNLISVTVQPIHASNS